MISILTVSPFFTYPVDPVMTSLIYKTHLSILARLYVPVESPAIVTLEEVYVVLVVASMILPNENAVGV